MKNIKIASAVALALGVAFAGSAVAASSNSDTITFTGSLTDATCTVSGGAGTDGGSGNFTVALDPIAATTLTAAGDTAAPKAFSVIIGGPGQGTCTNGKVASMSFLTSSPQVDAATGALKNAITGETNAEVQLLDSTSKAINLADASAPAQTATIANNTATINYTAQYYATAAGTPGTLSTSVVYNVVYN